MSCSRPIVRIELRDGNASHEPSPVPDRDLDALVGSPPLDVHVGAAGMQDRIRTGLGHGQDDIVHGRRRQSGVLGLLPDELPNFVELQVIETDPGYRGDTVSGGSTKPAKLESGASIQVPFHINTGDVVKVDTRADAYLERVKR